MNRWDILNYFIEKNNYKSYLEIGYFKGWSFDNVRCHLKVAVDPNPSKLDKDVTMPYGERRIIALVGEFEKDIDKCPTEALYKLTSDDFFEREKDCVFDIIFIDGLHEASQVERDIHNALNHLSPRGVIVMHDCNPPQYEHTTTGIAGCWTGDTYKAFIRFKMKYPEYESYVVDTDWGCGVIHNELSKEFVCDMPDKCIEEILEWNYFDSNRKSLLDLITVEEFKTKMDERTTDNNLPTQ